jgi:hypothetical protein
LRVQSELEKAKADRWFGLIPIGLGAVAALLGLIVAALSWHQLGVAKAMLTWPETEGTVTSSLYSSYREPGESFDSYSRSMSVSYVVNGQSYAYEQIGRVGEVEAKKNEPPYTVGQKVKIFYDPERPSTASLTRELGGPVYLGLIIAAICLLVSAPFFFFGFRSLSNARKRLFELQGRE